MSYENLEVADLSEEEIFRDSREARSKTKFREFIQSLCFSFFSACLSTGIVVVAFATVRKMTGMEYPDIDRQSCTCDCWDGLFKGHYGRGETRSLAIGSYFWQFQEDIKECIGTLIIELRGCSSGRPFTWTASLRWSTRVFEVFSQGPSGTSFSLV